MHDCCRKEGILEDAEAIDGLIYMNRIEHYPLLSYMQTMLIGQGNPMHNMTKEQII